VGLFGLLLGRWVVMSVASVAVATTLAAASATAALAFAASAWMGVGLDCPFCDDSVN